MVFSASLPDSDPDYEPETQPHSNTDSEISSGGQFHSDDDFRSGEDFEAILQGEWSLEHDWSVDASGRVTAPDSTSQPDPNCPVECQKRRARELMLTEVEFMDSEEFRNPELSESILAAAPERRSDQPADVKPAPEETPPYLADLYSIPLLTPEQEFHLFRQMNYLKYHAEVLRRRINPDRPNVGRLDQIEALLADALRVRNQIIRSNLRLVVAVARHLIDAVNDFDFLVSEGNVPLMRAVEIFDFTRGFRFSTYATWAVRNCLHRAAPRARKIRSRFRPGIEGVLDSEADPRSRRTHESYHREIEQVLQTLLPTLPEREQLIVRQRFGIDIERPLRFREIGEQMGLSTERVRQLYLRAMQRLRDAGEEHNLELPEA